MPNPRRESLRPVLRRKSEKCGEPEVVFRSPITRRAPRWEATRVAIAASSGNPPLRIRRTGEEGCTSHRSSELAGEVETGLQAGPAVGNMRLQVRIRQGHPGPEGQTLEPVGKLHPVGVEARDPAERGLPGGRELDQADHVGAFAQEQALDGCVVRIVHQNVEGEQAKAGGGSRRGGDRVGAVKRSQRRGLNDRQDQGQERETPTEPPEHSSDQQREDGVSDLKVGQKVDPPVQAGQGVREGRQSRQEQDQPADSADPETPGT